MISVWQHIVVVLLLFGSNALTAYFATRRIKQLRSALLAKKVILGSRVSPRVTHLRYGDTFHLKDSNDVDVVKVEHDQTTNFVKVTSFI